VARKKPGKRQTVNIGTINLTQTSPFEAKHSKLLSIAAFASAKPIHFSADDLLCRREETLVLNLCKRADPSDLSPVYCGDVDREAQVSRTGVMYNCEIIKGIEDGEVYSEMTLFIMRSVITALELLYSGGSGMIFRQLRFSFFRCLGGELNDVPRKL